MDGNAHLYRRWQDGPHLGHGDLPRCKTKAGQEGQLHHAALSVCLHMQLPHAPCPVPSQLAKNTVAKEIQDWRRHGYPPNLLYSCNKTAYFLEAECIKMIRAVRTNFNREASLLVVDDYKWHKDERFIDGLRSENCKTLHVVGGMTPLCNPGDRFIHKLLKADATLSYETWVLQQPLENGHVPSPPRSLSAKWFHDAMGKLSAASIARSFVACRVLRVEDYTIEEQKAYRLKELEHASLMGSVKEILLDNPELSEFAAQLDDMSDDDEVWLMDPKVTHQPAESGTPCEESDGSDTGGSGAATARAAGGGAGGAAAAAAAAAAVEESESESSSSSEEEEEVLPDQIVGAHVPYANLVGSDVCVLPAAYPLSKLKKAGTIGWRAEVTAKRGRCSSSAQIKVLGAWFDLNDKSRILSVVQEGEEEEGEEEEETGMDSNGDTGLDSSGDERPPQR